MIDLVRAELLKVRTTRGWWVYLGLIVLLVGLGTAADVGSTMAGRDSVEYQRGLVEAAGLAAVLAIILGITAVTTEFRHGTITPTLLHTPRRELVVAGKAIAVVLVSLGFVVLAVVVVALVAGVWLAAVGAENQFADSAVVERAGQVLLSVPLWALMGIAIGALIQSQVVALVGTLIWIFLGEGILIAFLGLSDLVGLGDLEGVADYLPFEALDAADGTTTDLLPYWVGVGVSLAWIAVIGAAGTERLRRRDIT
ncbi:MAG: ABC transporter permease [Actinomycetota bacterium]|nr:ABC transporter permease [Actinomycetota bacterium]